jgi:hypothetical protein
MIDAHPDIQIKTIAGTTIGAPSEAQREQQKKVANLKKFEDALQYIRKLDHYKKYDMAIALANDLDGFAKLWAITPDDVVDIIKRLLAEAKREKVEKEKSV